MTTERETPEPSELAMQAARAVMSDDVEGVWERAVVIEKFFSDYERQAPGWVSVEERLPDDSRTVLIVFEGPNKQPDYLLAYCRDEEWYDLGDDPQGNVTHWQELSPLPQTPGAEEGRPPY